MGLESWTTPARATSSAACARRHPRLGDLQQPAPHVPDADHSALVCRPPSLVLQHTDAAAPVQLVALAALSCGPLLCGLDLRSGFLLRRFASGTWIAPVCFEFIVVRITLVPRWSWCACSPLDDGDGKPTLRLVCAPTCFRHASRFFLLASVACAAGPSDGLASYCCAASQEAQEQSLAPTTTTTTYPLLARLPLRTLYASYVFPRCRLKR
ncbi:hypothetical protein GGX14DRAFT_570813 [Mycena pura]|uniref:Uncharacterized protein n=1 Tax=Mycena pura TaxID=153505 RepID=A0AAD6V4D2_9AGAR|nr:hypothetical protein GGX14DRAFT_570813 [Mycena pura]